MDPSFLGERKIFKDGQDRTQQVFITSNNLLCIEASNAVSLIARASKPHTLFEGYVLLVWAMSTLRSYHQFLYLMTLFMDVFLDVKQYFDASC